jgi:hypothetical protein
VSFVERSILTDPGLTGALQAGETARTYATVAQVVPGAERTEPLGVEPPAPEREGAGSFFTGAWMPRWARSDRAERIFGGVARWGVAGSYGATLHSSLDVADGLVVTDHTLVAVEAGDPRMVDDPDRPGRKISSRPYRSVWSCALTDVASARRAGRLTGRGRVEIFFHDQSMCAVMAGVVSTGAADRLVTALNRHHQEKR